MRIKEVSFIFIFSIIISLIFSSIITNFKPVSAEIFKDDTSYNDKKGKHHEKSKNAKKKGLKVFVDIRHHHEKDVKLCLASERTGELCKYLDLSEYGSPYRHETNINKGSVKKGEEFVACIYNTAIDLQECVIGKNKSGKKPEHVKLSVPTRENIEESFQPASLCGPLDNKVVGFLTDLFIGFDSHDCHDLLDEDRSSSERLLSGFAISGKALFNAFFPPQKALKIYKSIKTVTKIDQ